MKRLFFVFAGIIFASLVFAQSPEMFQYQSVVRDANGNVVTGQLVSFQISIYSGSATGTLVYSETHSVSTNSFGLAVLKIGNGSVVSGTFSGISWGNDVHFMKVEVDINGGTAYDDMGTTQLISVPYALHSKTSEDAFSGSYNDLTGVPTDVSTFNNDAGYLTSFTEVDGDVTNELQIISISNDTIYLSNGGHAKLPAGFSGNYSDLTGAPTNVSAFTNDVGYITNPNDADSDPANEIQTLSLTGNNLSLTGGGTVSMSGYVDTLWKSNGNKIYNSNSGNVGVGLNNPGGKMVVQGDANLTDSDPLFEVKDRTGATVFVVYPDSVRISVGDDGSKTNKGAFAVSGRNTAKQTTHDFFKVTPDSVRVFLDSTSTKGGFAVQAFGNSADRDYMSVYVDTAQTIDPSVSRMLWYPSKEAFLSGRVLIESPDSVGTNSWATGYESKAIGNWSQALGYRARARGIYSTAIGKNANAGFSNSYAFGDGAKALNQDAYAFGAYVEARGVGSFAFGYVGRDTLGPTGTITKATGNYSFAFGLGSQSIGTYSIAFGAGDSATGFSSVALGYYNKAINSYAVALGRNTVSGGYASTAVGNKSKANGDYSFSGGSYSEANGDWSFAYGSVSTTQGSYSSALGYHATANGNYSFAAGNSCIAEGGYSVAMGDQSHTLGGWSTAIGNEVYAEGESSTAFGRMTIASGLRSTAMGNLSQANGDYSFAAGNSCIAEGGYSIAIGDQSRTLNGWSTAIGNEVFAEGESSTALGRMTIARGLRSTAIGNYTLASGTTSTAMGTNTTASGNFSTSAGYYTKATGIVATAFGHTTMAKPYASFVVGRYNDTTGTATSWISTEPLFIIGNGSSDAARSNAVTVLKDGRTGIGTISPATLLDINGSAKIGTNGTAITNIIKVTSTVDLPSIAVNGYLSQIFTVTNAAVGSTVYISPDSDLTNGLVICWARVSAANTVKVNFKNTSTAAIDLASMDWYITVIQ